MSLFSKARRRSTTRFVVALWLFALAGGVSQACGLGESLAQAGIANPASVAAHQDPCEDPLPACEQFCADDTPLLAKLKIVGDGPAGSALLVGAPTSGAPISAPLRAYKPRPGMDLPPGIAINTRFVRLAL